MDSFSFGLRKGVELEACELADQLWNPSLQPTAVADPDLEHPGSNTPSTTHLHEEPASIPTVTLSHQGYTSRSGSGSAAGRLAKAQHQACTETQDCLQVCCWFA